jgi:hypothetical protein
MALADGAVREVFGSLGFARLVPAPDGFVAYRDRDAS